MRLRISSSKALAAPESKDSAARSTPSAKVGTRPPTFKINAAVSSRLGVSDQKILALDRYRESDLYSSAERVALEYADAMTLSDRDVDDDLFQRLRLLFTDPAIVELTAVIAWENSSSKFNRALRIESQQLWKRGADGLSHRQPHSGLRRPESAGR